jgi:hypothetical protein
MGKKATILAVLGVATLAALLYVATKDTAPATNRGDDARVANGALRDAVPNEETLQTPRRHTPVVDRAKADKMREELHRLLAEAGTLQPSPDPATGRSPGPLSATGRPLAPMPAPGPGTDGGPSPLAAYIRERVREDFMPLAGKCYENELAKNPKLAGRAVVKFRIVGDKRIGGVVDSADIDKEKSDLSSPTFVQCMSESMMSVSFGAPPEGHPETTVDYPFIFSPDDEPDTGPPR